MAMTYHDVIQPHKEALFKYYQKYESEITSRLKSLPQKLTQKSVSYSKTSRLEGNKLFKRSYKDIETIKQIFVKYTKSISYAPKDSEHLALAYESRSALLLHIKEFEETIKDIDRAHKITKCVTLKIKLICKKVECLKRLGRFDDDKILNEAISLLTKFKKGSKEREFYEELIEEAKGQFEIYGNHIKTIKKTIPQDGILHENENKKVNDFSDIYLDYEKAYGKLLRAKKDFKTGEIVFVEKLYAAVPITERNFQMCNHCSLMTWSSIPCDNCSWALYCSENCKKEAWEKYHDFECPIICQEDCLKDLRDSDIVIRTFIMGIKEAGTISKLKTELEGGNKYIYTYMISYITKLFF